MQIVIDIPEDEYQNILHTGKASFRVVNAIEAGMILPKGHGRLIDENDLWFEDIDDISCVTQRNVENAPTIIEADKE